MDCLYQKPVIAFIISAITSSSYALTSDTPDTPPPELDMRHCEQLYLKATELEMLSQNRMSSIYSNENNTVAGIVSTVFTPALYFLGYSKYQQLASEHHAKTALPELDAIRARMAELRCFE